MLPICAWQWGGERPPLEQGDGELLRGHTPRENWFSLPQQSIFLSSSKASGVTGGWLFLLLLFPSNPKQQLLVCFPIRSSRTEPLDEADIWSLPLPFCFFLSVIAQLLTVTGSQSVFWWLGVCDTRWLSWFHVATRSVFMSVLLGAFCCFASPYFQAIQRLCGSLS